MYLFADFFPSFPFFFSFFEQDTIEYATKVTYFILGLEINLYFIISLISFFPLFTMINFIIYSCIIFIFYRSLFFICFIYKLAVPFCSHFLPRPELPFIITVFYPLFYNTVSIGFRAWTLSTRDFQGSR
jgi:hypothetical protein